MNSKVKSKRSENYLYLTFRLILNHIKVLLFILILFLFVYWIFRSEQSNDSPIIKPSIPLREALLGTEFSSELNSVADTNGTYCPNFDDKVILTATSDGETIDDYIWEYINLLAIKHHRFIDLSVYLSSRTTKQLLNIFKKLYIEDICTVIPACDDLSSVQIITPDERLTVDKLLSKQPIYVLRDNGSSNRRYLDVFTDTDLNANEKILTEMRSAMEFRDELLAFAAREITLTRIRLGIPENESRPIIGMYIKEQSDLSVETFQRAINLQRKFHASAIFLIICSGDRIEFCYESFPDNENGIRTMESYADDEYNLALLSQCSHSIVGEVAGIIPALLNGGDTVVFDYTIAVDKFKNNRYLPYLIASKLNNWYAIG